MLRIIGHRQVQLLTDALSSPPEPAVYSRALVLNRFIAPSMAMLDREIARWLPDQVMVPILLEETSYTVTFRRGACCLRRTHRRCSV